MKKQEKRMILILLAVLAIVIIALVINKNAKKENKENKAETANNTVTEEFVQVLEDGTKLNTSTELNKEKQVGNYKFENMQLTTQDNQTVLLADVTNTGSSKTDIQLVDITLLDKDGKEIANLRLENPDMPLLELGKLLKNPVGKSGVNYRLKKIIEIANED